jgi:hypothetical protein
LVDGAATMDFMLEDFVTRMGLHVRKSCTKTHIQLANGKRVSLSKLCGIVSFIVAHNVCERAFKVLCDLHATDDIVLDLPWTKSKRH